MSTTRLLCFLLDVAPDRARSVAAQLEDMGEAWTQHALVRDAAVFWTEYRDVFGGVPPTPADGELCISRVNDFALPGARAVAIRAHVRNERARQGLRLTHVTVEGPPLVQTPAWENLWDKVSRKCGKRRATPPRAPLAESLAHVRGLWCCCEHVRLQDLCLRRYCGVAWKTGRSWRAPNKMLGVNPVTRRRLAPRDCEALVKTWDVMTPLDVVRAGCTRDPLLCQLLAYTPLILVLGRYRTTQELSLVQVWLDAVCPETGPQLLLVQGSRDTVGRAIARRPWCHWGVPAAVMQHALPRLANNSVVALVAPGCRCVPAQCIAGPQTRIVTVALPGAVVPKVPPKGESVVARVIFNNCMYHIPKLSGRELRVDLLWDRSDGLHCQLLTGFCRKALRSTLGELVYLAHVCGLLGRCCPELLLSPCTQQSTKAIVLLDNRPNPWSVASVLLTRTMLPDGWGVHVFCGKDNAKYMRRHLPECTVIHRVNAMDGRAFGVPAYNRLLLRRRFWKTLVEAGLERILLVQDDSALLRPGLDARMLSCVCLGAPWSPDNPPELAQEVGPMLVGNGGLSLRDPAFCETSLRTFRSLRVSFDRADLPEDVFFSSCMHRQGLCPPRAVAEEFSLEQGPVSRLPLGVHKVYAYHSPDVVQALLRRFWFLQ
jgi:hypothetical protein